MKQKKREKKKERKKIEERDQVKEEEERGADMEEDKVEITMKGSTAIEEIEEDIGQEEEVFTEEEDEGVVGRTLLHLPRRSLRPGRKPR